MKKQILPRICLLLLCLLLLRPICAFAATPLDPDTEASLTLHYQKEDSGFEELQVRIYRVAEAFPDGTFELIAPYNTYPVNIHGITAQEQWQFVAATLSAYVIADQLQPDYEAKTDAEGTVKFEDLQTGLYLVREVTADNSDGTYIFNQFMVYLPTPQPDGSLNYGVEAYPKCISFVPKTEYTVTKLWQDPGDQSARPDQVPVEIYRDGILYDTQILNAENNWTYKWQVSEADQSLWTVVERDVPEQYTVTIQQNGSAFSIINARQSEPVKPPQTGDSFALLPWMMAMCLLGIVLLSMGACRGRRR